MNSKIFQLEKAQKLLLDKVRATNIELTPILQANEKLLAEEIFAPVNVPHFRKSPLDGFAIIASDTLQATRDNPKKIKIIDEVAAGDTRVPEELPLGCGVKILTGGPLPLNANAVLRKEDVQYINNEVIINYELRENSNIIESGNDIKKDQLVFKKGEFLTPYHIGVLASLGISDIQVYSSPKIGVLSTGSELQAPGESLENGKIYNSNAYSLLALIQSLGCQGEQLGIVEDSVEEIEKSILKGFASNDILLTTGGASVGDYDLIEDTFKKLNIKILFNHIAIKPGSHVIAGIKNSKLIIGLSGNPAAALISFELLVRPLVKKLRGFKEVDFKYLDVELADGFYKKSPQRRFLRVNVQYQDDKWVAYNTNNQQSSILLSMVGCNALIDVPAGAEPIKPNTVVKALLLKDIL